MFGFPFCQSCRAKLGLLSDKTIAKHIQRYKTEKEHSYEDEVARRLASIDKNVALQKVKLLHILERITELTEPGLTD